MSRKDCPHHAYKVIYNWATVTICIVEQRDDNGVVCKLDYMSVLVEALTLICIKNQSGERTRLGGNSGR